MKFLGETRVTKIEGTRSVPRSGEVPPRIEVTFSTTEGMGVLVLHAREAALLRNYLAEGLENLQK